MEAAEEQRRQAAAAQGSAAAAQAAAEQAAAEGAAQLAVVMETLEVLQSGSPDAQREHVLALTAELAAGRVKEASLEQRCAAAERRLEAARAQVGG